MPALRRGVVPVPPGDGAARLDAVTAVPAGLGQAADVAALPRRAGQRSGEQRPDSAVAVPGGGRGSGPAPLFAGAYPGTPDQVSRARAELAAALDGCPAAEDALICLAEIAANAVIHSRSGIPGGHFGVRADAHPGVWVQVAVDDDGGPWDEHHAGDGAEHGRGLRIVRALSAQMGITGDDSGRTVWFRCMWHAA